MAVIPTFPAEKFIWTFTFGKMSPSTRFSRFFNQVLLFNLLAYYHYHRQIFTVWSIQTPVTLIVQDNGIIVCIYSSYFNKLDFEQKFCITIPFKILINFNKSEASSTNCFYLFIYFTLLSGGIAVVWGRFVIVRGRVASYTLPLSRSLLQMIFYCLDQTPI